MAYCPVCKSEYREGITTCQDCGTSLTPPPHVSQTNIDDEIFVQVLSTDNREDIITAKQVLDGAHIDSIVRQENGGVFPTHVGFASEIRVSVPAQSLSVAHALLEEAMSDGAISRSGTLLA